MRFRFLRHRAAALDKRVDEARRHAETATREAEMSRERAERVKETIVEPLRKAGMHNQFAEMLRRSLIQGHHS